MVPALETMIWRTAFNCCFRIQLAPLHTGGANASGAGASGSGAPAAPGGGGGGGGGVGGSGDGLWPVEELRDRLLGVSGGSVFGGKLTKVTVITKLRQQCGSEALAAHDLQGSPG
jgi:hypothetical protein